MLLREWKNRFLAVPWVYDNLRPLVAGGIDVGTLTGFCGVQETDRVFDLGCGTGQVLPFLRCSEYLGVDLDPTALRKASRFAAPRVRFMEGNDWDESYRQLRPTIILMIGVVHHLPDDDFRSIVERFRKSSDLPVRLATIDVTFFPGRHVNNLLSRLDRGGHVRTPARYEELFCSTGLGIQKNEILPTRLGYVRYIGYLLAL